MITIYGLADPRDGALRYIGITSTPLAARLRSHVYSRRFQDAGFEPEIFEVETYSSEQGARDAERFWIAYFRGLGCDLLNVSPGGALMADSSRAKLSAACRGRSVWNKGIPRSAETKAKLSAANSGRRLPEETRARMRAAAMSRCPHAPATRAKIAASLIGNRRAAGTRPSALNRALTAERNRGRVWTPEARAKIAAANRARWAR